MAGDGCENFWYCIDELKSQIHSQWRIAELTRKEDKEEGNAVVRLQDLSR